MHSDEPLVSPGSDYYTYHPSAIASRVYLYPVCLGHFFYQPGYTLQRSRFDSILLMYIVSGSCTLTVGSGETLDAPAGSFVLLDCYKPHGYSFSAASEVNWLHFDGCSARNYYEEIVAMHGHVIGSSGMPATAAGLETILDLFRGSRTLREAFVSNTITDMLQTLLESSIDERADHSRAHAIERARTYISEHYAEPISLEMLAEGANLSPYHFTRVFAAETGNTPHQYLIAVRLSAARYLLRTQSMPSIKEIAGSCGFNSESSFCTTFRKWEGVTPSEFRRMAFPDAP